MIIRRRTILTITILSAISVAFPFLVSQYGVRIAIDALLYAYLGVAWNISGGYSGQSSFGHAAFFGLGAYGAALFFVATGFTPWAGLFVGAILAVGFALLMGFLSFRFGLSGHFFFLVSIAFAEALRIFFDDFEPVGGSVGIYIPFKPGYSVYYMQFSPSYTPYYFLFLGLLAFGLVVSLRIRNSRFGHLLLTIREDETAAESVGVPTLRYKIAALSVSALLTSIGGAIFAFYLLYISPDSVMDLNLSVYIVIVVIVGGVGTLVGPVIGAFIVMPAIDLTTAYFGSTAGLGPFLAGAVLLVMALGRPQGVWGLFEKVRR